MTTTSSSSIGQEVSDMLAAALEQMDGIIASAKFENQNGGNTSSHQRPRGQLQYTRIIKLLEDLKLALDLCEDKKRVICQVPHDLLKYVSTWLSMATEEARKTNGYVQEDVSDRVERLESDKRSLMLQVSVLTEQVEAQSEKIRELEYSVEEKRHKIMNTEELLQAELLTRSSLETHKLDLMAEISSLKIRLATAEKDRRDLEDKFKTTQRHIADLEARLALKDAEVADLRQRLARNGTVLPTEVNGRDSFDAERSLDKLFRQQHEVERLKKAVDALMVSNTEKDKRIEELRRLLKRYKKIEEMVVQAQGRKVLEDLMLNIEDDTSSTSSTTPSVTDSGGKENNRENNMGDDRGDRPTYNLSPSATSTPAHTEVVTDDEDGLQHVPHHHEHKKKKGLRRFFGKLKRSGSQDFHERERLEEFRRGGTRATATARLGWSRDVRNDDISKPFARWNTEQIIAWMNNIGLNMYMHECRNWVRTGEQLLKASQHELEKELGMRHPLHRKKLQLALRAISSGSTDKVNDLDHLWVTRWLDDIGLPQYKDQFHDARVDGRMLDVMTVDDLLAMKVVNELHHISIKRGIQILRLNAFNQGCLKRRPTPDEGALFNIPGDVCLWTNHRVMEWLRTIDLSEYAPNMRGSGVHGALMVLEPRFNAELFAQLLSIPNNKTLLRRHLSTHFVSLIGNEVQIKKREHEALPGYIPLVPNAKVKKGKFGLFGHKRSKSEPDTDSYICPLDLTSPFGGKLTNGSAVPSRPLTKEEKEQEQKAAQEIGVYSKEITSLTHMLARENFLDNVPTSNV